MEELLPIILILGLFCILVYIGIDGYKESVRGDIKSTQVRRINGNKIYQNEYTKKYLVKIRIGSIFFIFPYYIPLQYITNPDDLSSLEYEYKIKYFNTINDAKLYIDQMNAKYIAQKE